ncbi:hypothetical protein [Legionella sp. PATHC039]|nr:hypothetical protein [Legionella sp. PATHC039]MCW8394339.1 hypothetical protein [Legionella sp. PATHC039]
MNEAPKKRLQRSNKMKETAYLRDFKREISKRQSQGIEYHQQILA